MGLLVIFLFAAFSSKANVEQLNGVGPVELGQCEPKIDGGSEEARARRLAQTAQITPTEALTRLVFSEALSTGYWSRRCDAPSGKKLFELITWGVINRVAKDKTQDRFINTIFAPKQFRTSFSKYKSNPFARAFLCPLKAEVPDSPAAVLFGEARTVVELAVAHFNQHGIPQEFAGITHFFYPRSLFFGDLRPPWAPSPDPTKNRGYRKLLTGTRPCVEFYGL